MQKIFFSLITLGLFLSGCANRDGGDASPENGVASKPLPACESTVAVQIVGAVEQYFGFTVNRDSEIAELNGKNSQYKFIEPRDNGPKPVIRREEIQVIAQTFDGQIMSQSIEIEIPNCAARDEYQKSHPGYSEPIVKMLQF